MINAVARNFNMTDLVRFDLYDEDTLQLVVSCSRSGPTRYLCDAEHQVRWKACKRIGLRRDLQPSR